MGLDMYLFKKTYVKNWEHKGDDNYYIPEFRKKNGDETFIRPERVTYIVEEVMYWRKANQIHKWFVDNVQDEDDNCGEYYVSRNQLAELRDLCKQVLESTVLIEGAVINGYTCEGGVKIPIIEDGKVMENSRVAEELLPVAEGFFFGSTEYNEWYYNDIKETYETLNDLLSEEGDGGFYYQSSW
jgi:hypothetical protein